MKSFWNNYKSSIVLGAILLGGIVGATMGEKAVVLKPIGELFLNLLFMTLVPLVFFSVTSAIANMGGGMQRLGKILKSIVIVFLGTALVAAVIGLVGVLLMNPTKGLDTSLFKDIISSANDSSATEKVGLLQQIVNTFTVNDFSLLLSRSNMLQLIVFSIFTVLSALTTILGSYYYMTKLFKTNPINRNIAIYLILVIVSGTLAVFGANVVFEAVDLLLFVLCGINVTTLMIFTFKEWQKYRIDDQDLDGENKIAS